MTRDSTLARLCNVAPVFKTGGDNFLFILFFRNYVNFNSLSNLGIRWKRYKKKDECIYQRESCQLFTDKDTAETRIMNINKRSSK